MMVGRRFYYTLKPFLPWRLRMAARRARARRIREGSGCIWPIHEEAGRPPENWRGWPEGRKFAFVLTHDVEGARGLARCRRLAELEMTLGFRSSFNFIPEGSYCVSSGLRAWLADQGFEVGVHDLHHDGHLYRSLLEFRENAGRINRYLKEWNASGFRSGFMLHELDWIHDLDIEYDSSTFDTDPFEPQPDAAGTIFPFWVPAPEPRTANQGYVELPYTLPQDSTLFLLLRETSPDIWARKLDWIARKGGMALVNVHPDYVQFPGEAAGPRTFPAANYVALLEHVRKNYGDEFWHPLPRALAREIAAVRPIRPNRRQKRVCIVAHSFYERDTRVLRYGEALAERGDEVDVVSLRSSPDLPKEEIIAGCRVVRVQDRLVDERSSAILLWRLLKFLRRSSRWISRSHAARPYDLIHVHNVPDFLVFAAWRPKLSGAKVILDIHDIVPELFASKFGAAPGSLTMRMLKWMERASAAFASHVILANDLWLDAYTRRSARPEKVSVLLNFVDSRIFAPRPRLRQDGRKIVVFPGSLQTHQGLDVAIRAFPRVVAELPAAELHIYGEGPAKPDLITLTAELGLGGQVKFFDGLPVSKIVEVMADADLGVVPKRADSFGNEAYSTKILEFMSLGIPVVAASTKVDRYYFDSSVLRFFESGNPESLAREIVDVLRHPEMARQMAARAAEYAARNSWESRKADYLGLVDRLCASP